MGVEAKVTAVHPTHRQNLQLVYRLQAERHAQVASPIRMLLGTFVFNPAQAQLPGAVWS